MFYASVEIFQLILRQAVLRCWKKRKLPVLISELSYTIFLNFIIKHIKNGI